MSTLCEPISLAEMRARAREAHDRLMGMPPNPSTRFFRPCRLKTISVTDMEIDTCSRQHLTEAEELIGKLRVLDVTLRHMTEAEEIIARLRQPVHRIIWATCQYFGMRRIDLLSSRRTKGIVRPRHIAMFLSRELTRYSLPEIGRRFGGRDHTTVLHACRTVAQLSVEHPDFAFDVAAIRALAIESIQPWGSHDQPDRHLLDAGEMRRVAPSRRRNQFRRCHRGDSRRHLPQRGDQQSSPHGRSEIAHDERGVDRSDSKETRVQSATATAQAATAHALCAAGCNSRAGAVPCHHSKTQDDSIHEAQKRSLQISVWRDGSVSILWVQVRSELVLVSGAFTGCERGEASLMQNQFHDGAAGSVSLDSGHRFAGGRGA